MFLVSDIAPDVRRVLGQCNDATVLDRINSAVEVLAAEIDLDTTIGYVDVCVDENRCFALPDEVEQVLAVNIGGTPAPAHDKYWNFHLNGPGLSCADPANYDWVDRMSHPTRIDPEEGFKVVAYLDSASDNNAAVRVLGYDTANRWVTSEESGVTVDGFLVPTVYGSPAVNPDAPFLSRITGIVKDETKGYIRLQTLDGDVLGDYRPFDTVPRYRRIRLSKSCTWARVMFKRKYSMLRTMSDIVPLASKQAVIRMCQAQQKYDSDRADEARVYERKAIEHLKNVQRAQSPPAGPSIQIADRNLIVDKTDRLDY
jgi:hypothetical protein